MWEGGLQGRARVIEGRGREGCGRAIEKGLSVWRTRFRGMGGDGLLYLADGGRTQHRMGAHIVGRGDAVKGALPNPIVDR